MKIRIFFYILLVFFTGLGAASVPFYKVGPGKHNYAGLIVKADQAWNQAPEKVVKSARIESKVWTQNGILLDRIMIIPAVPNGEPIFRQTSSSQALPLFDVGMLPNEIEELVESSIVKLFGEGGARVETSMLRPQRFGQSKGIMFNLEASVSDGLDYKGVTGAMVFGEKLYLVIFLGAETYYYDRYLDEAVQIIKSARVEGATATDVPLPSVSGIYTSEITSNSTFINTQEYQDFNLEIRQLGNEISGTIGGNVANIYGTINEDVIKFSVSDSAITGGYSLEGSWRVSSDGKRITGKWGTRRYGSGGKWNLTRIE